jgi:Ni,Fe-hydrogenase I cytochrome b subunit
MNNLKLIFSFKNKKTFLQALGFYFIHILFAFVLTLIISIILFAFILNSDALSSGKDIIFAKLFYTGYLIIISLFIIKNRTPQNKMGYLCLMLLGAITTYIFTPWLGYLFLAYITTLGKGKNEMGTTIV